MKSNSLSLRIIQLLIIIPFLLNPLLALSTPSQLDALLLDIKEKSASLDTLSCDFTQKRTLALFNKPIIFQGELNLIRPDKLRWEFISPVPSVLIFNGDKGLRCNENSDPTQFDLANDPVMKIVAQQLWTWLDGDYTKLKDNYNISRTGDSAIVVTPTNSSHLEIIKDISIVFHSTNRQPQSVTIREPGGDETLITFQDYILDQPLPESTFTKCFAHD